MTATADRAIDCAMPSGLPSLPLLAEVAIGRRALPAGISSLGALLRLDPVWVLRLLRVSDRIAVPVEAGLSTRLDAVMEACGEPLLQAALLDAHEQAARHGQISAGHRAFWAHSLFTAEVARELALCSGSEDPDDCFVAGLLLDVGLLLRAGQTEGADGILNEQALAAREYATTGLNHGQLGAALLGAGWAADLADALRFSHTDPVLFGDAPPFVRIARAAEELASGADAARQTVLALEIEQLTPDALDVAMQRAAARTKELCAVLGLDEAGAVFGDSPYRPVLDAGPMADEAVSAMGELARAGLFDRMCARGDDAGVLGSLKLATGLLLDMPAPRLLRALQGGTRFAEQDDEAGEATAALDLSQPGVTGIARTLADGQAWRCVDARQADALPVGVQRLFGLTAGRSCLLQPVMDEGRIEAVALFSLPAAFQPRTRELVALCSAVGRGLGRRARQQRELHELRNALNEQMQANAGQLRADLSTPLGLLRHQIKSMRLKMGADSMVDAELTVFGDQIERMETVLRQFEDRPQELAGEARRVDLNQLLEQTLADAESRLLRARSISSELHLDAAMPPLHLPLPRLRELLHILLASSAENVGTSGRIAVSTADGLNLNGTLFAEIRVRDFGRGMDAGQVATLFAPDGSLSSRRSLPRALALARELGGSLSCKSAVGQGTVFQLLLPRHIRRLQPGPV